MFSQETLRNTGKNFEARMKALGKEKSASISAELNDAMKIEKPEVIHAIKWIISSLPLSDTANYPFSLFLNSARHGVFLSENSPYLKNVPEEIFLCFVLQPRVGNEQLSDCRQLFYDMTRERIKSLDAEDAVIELNYFNAENLTYKSTDSRTLSALSAMKAHFGRCGEESVFAVNVFRAAGIPARQIYTPRWAHCDDNHAWVEVFVNGKWAHLGACEPEEILNRGWFTQAAARAVLIHGRAFGRISGEEVISENDVMTVFNVTSSYAQTKELVISTEDEYGPVEGAEVSFAVLNYSDFFPAAVVKTDKNGKARLSCGRGTVNVRAVFGNKFAEATLPPSAESAVLTLSERFPLSDVWTDFVSQAPPDRLSAFALPDENQKKANKLKLMEASSVRKRKTELAFDEKRFLRLDKSFKSDAAFKEKLMRAGENASAIMDFLEYAPFSPSEKLSVIRTLSDKDMCDVDIRVLSEAITKSRDFRGMYPEDIFEKYILAPRVADEPLSAARTFILNCFPSHLTDTFRADPPSIKVWIDKNISYLGDSEYDPLITLPCAALTVKSASDMSKKILFVNICRTLGIPARLDPLTQREEYYVSGCFRAVETQTAPDAFLTLKGKNNEEWNYGPDFSVSQLNRGKWTTLSPENSQNSKNTFTIPVKSGFYRIITDNRLPSGNIKASVRYIHISKGQNAVMILRRNNFTLNELSVDFRIGDFALTPLAGDKTSLSRLSSGPLLIVWAERGTEPSEHLFSELEAVKERPAFSRIGKIFIAGSEEKANELKMLLGDIPGAGFCVSDEDSRSFTARNVYADPDRAPLVLVTDKPLHVVFVMSGYNVGGAELTAKFIQAAAEENMP